MFRTFYLENFKRPNSLKLKTITVCLGKYSPVMTMFFALDHVRRSFNNSNVSILPSMVVLVPEGFLKQNYKVFAFSMSSIINNLWFKVKMWFHRGLGSIMLQLGTSDNVNIETDNQNLLLPAVWSSFGKVISMKEFLPKPFWTIRVKNWFLGLASQL